MAKNFGPVKKEYLNFPASVPVGWARDMESHAETLGISRNAAFCLAVKMGAPILSAHVRTMRDVQRQILEGICRTGNQVKLARTVSKILGATRKAGPVVSGAGEQRKSRKRKA